jgi:hypothetical protein
MHGSKRASSRKPVAPRLSEFSENFEVEYTT